MTKRKNTLRTDAQKNLGKVAKEVLTNPLSTQREIAENTGIGLGTVNRATKELEQTGTKDDRIKGLLDGDLELLKKIQERKQKRMKDENIDDNVIDRWENTANKRRIMFGIKDNNDGTPTNVIINIE